MRRLIILGIVVCVSACSGGNGRSVEFYRKTEEKLDKTCSWLSKRDNFQSGDYKKVFQEYYSKNLKDHHVAKAASALEQVTDQEVYFSDFSEETVQTVHTFGRRFRKSLPVHQTTFLDDYLGNFYTDRGDFNKAIPHFKRITRLEPVDFKSCISIAYAWNDLGFCYSSIGDQQAALKADYKALELFNRTDDTVKRGVVYNNLFLVYMFTKDYYRCEHYINKAIHVYAQEKDYANLFTILYNKMLLYEEMGNPKRFDLIDSTYHAFRASRVNDPSLKISIYNYYVQKLLHDGKYAEARLMLDQLKPEVEALNSEFASTEYIVSEADYELTVHKQLADVTLIKKALKVFEENEHYQMQFACYATLKSAAESRGDHKLALYYAEKSYAASERLATEKTRLKTMQLDRKYQAEKRRNQIIRQREALVTQNVIIWLLVTILFGLVLAILIVRSWQRQKKIESESVQAKRFTRQLLEKTEEERKRIAADLHDSVSHELLNLKHDIRMNTPDSEARIDSLINDIRVISRNLHPVMFEKVGLAASLQQLVERTQIAYDLMVTADIDYDASLSSADELQLYRIVQEALSNTIKYARAFAAKIILLSHEGGLHVMIKDNGVGFNVEETLSGPAGFGLHNILERSKAIGGQARITSGPNGTIITIEIRKTL